MNLISSCLVLFSLLVPFSSQAMYGSSYNHMGGGGGYYGGPSVHQQNTSIIRNMEAMARSNSSPDAVQRTETSADRERMWKEEQEEIKRVKLEKQIAQNEARNREEKTRLDRIAIERRELITQTEKNALIVNETVYEARKLLYSPEIESKMQPDAIKFTEQQLNTAEQMTHAAWSYAAYTFNSAQIVKLSSDLGQDVINSTNRFLGSVAGGFYDGFVTSSQAMQAIYQDPTLILNLSNNMVHALSEGPGYFIHEVSLQIDNFHRVMGFGNAEQRGQAIGHLGANILLAMTVDEITGGLRTGTEMLRRTGNVLNTTENRPLGEALNQGLRTNQITGPLMEASNQRLMQQIEQAFERHLDRCIEIRDAYNVELPVIRETAQRMLNEGGNVEAVARHVHHMRMELATRMKELTPEEIRPHLYDRNIQKYGNPYGPSIEYLRNVKYKSWEDIIEGASRSNHELNSMIESARLRRGQI